MSAALDNIRNSINSSRAVEVQAAALFEQAVMQLLSVPSFEDLKPSDYLRGMYPYLSYSTFQRDSLEPTLEPTSQSPIRTIKVVLKLDKDTTVERLGRKIAAFNLARKQAVDQLVTQAAKGTGGINFDVCGPVNIEFARASVQFMDDPAFKRREAAIYFSLRALFFSADIALIQ
jgi:hypothetical protein